MKRLFLRCNQSKQCCTLESEPCSILPKTHKPHKRVEMGPGINFSAEYLEDINLSVIQNQVIQHGIFY